MPEQVELKAYQLEELTTIASRLNALPITIKQLQDELAALNSEQESKKNEIKTIEKEVVILKIKLGTFKAKRMILEAEAKKIELQNTINRAQQVLPMKQKYLASLQAMLRPDEEAAKYLEKHRLIKQWVRLCDTAAIEIDVWKQKIPAELEAKKLEHQSTQAQIQLELNELRAKLSALKAEDEEADSLGVRIGAKEALLQEDWKEDVAKQSLASYQAMLALQNKILEYQKKIQRESTPEFLKETPEKRDWLAKEAEIIQRRGQLLPGVESHEASIDELNRQINDASSAIKQLDHIILTRNMEAEHCPLQDIAAVKEAETAHASLVDSKNNDLTRLKSILENVEQNIGKKKTELSKAQDELADINSNEKILSYIKNPYALLENATQDISKLFEKFRGKDPLQQSQKTRTCLAGIEDRLKAILVIASPEEKMNEQILTLTEEDWNQRASHHVMLSRAPEQHDKKLWQERYHALCGMLLAYQDSLLLEDNNSFSHELKKIIEDWCFIDDVPACQHAYEDFVLTAKWKSLSTPTQVKDAEYRNYSKENEKLTQKICFSGVGDRDEDAFAADHSYAHVEVSAALKEKIEKLQASIVEAIRKEKISSLEAYAVIKATNDLCSKPNDPTLQEKYAKLSKQVYGKSSLRKQIAGIMMAIVGLVGLAFSIAVTYFSFGTALPCTSYIGATSAGLMLGGFTLFKSGRQHFVSKAMHEVNATCKKQP